MADSVLFDGIDDKVTLSKGAAGGGGAVTIAAVVKVVSTSPDVQGFVTWAFTRWGCWMSGPAAVYYDGIGGGDSSSGTQTLLNTWRLIVYNHPGGASTGRWHDYDGSTWVHETGTGSTNTNPSVGASIIIGAAGSELLNGNMLIFGWKDSDTTVDADLLPLANGYQAWIDFGFEEGVRFDAASGLTSFVAGGTMAETSRTGTTVDTGDVPSWWDDDLGPPATFEPAIIHHTVGGRW